MTACSSTTGNQSGATAEWCLASRLPWPLTGRGAADRARRIAIGPGSSAEASGERAAAGRSAGDVGGRFLPPGSPETETAIPIYEAASRGTTPLIPSLPQLRYPAPWIRFSVGTGRVVERLGTIKSRLLLSGLHHQYCRIQYSVHTGFSAVSAFFTLRRQDFRLDAVRRDKCSVSCLTRDSVQPGPAGRVEQVAGLGREAEPECRTRSQGGGRRHLGDQALALAVVEMD